MGLFLNFHILLRLRGLGDNGAFLSYDVLQDGQLRRISLEDECLAEASEATLKPIRIRMAAKLVWKTFLCLFIIYSGHMETKLVRKRFLHLLHEVFGSRVYIGR